MSQPLVVLGSVNIDLVLRCAHLPQPGQTLHGERFDSAIGGKGANQAVAAARLGAVVRFIGCVGDDGFGAQARARLDAEGIDTRHLNTLPSSATGVAMIWVDAKGQNCIGLAAGANAGLTLAHVDAAAASIRAAGLLVCQLESPLDVVTHAIEIANGAGVPVLLNPAPGQPLPDELLERIDLLVPNETEAAILVGASAGTALVPAEAARALRRRGASTVLITLGGDGVQVASAMLEAHRPAPRVQPVDTTGAGDTFIGAFAAARLAGADLDGAIAQGQQAAAWSVTRPGAMDAMPHRADLALPSGSDCA